ncbi:MAG: thermonuclease family protein [Rickettsiales bacterium]
MKKDINLNLSTLTLVTIFVIIYYSIIHNSKAYYGNYNQNLRSFTIEGKAKIIDGDSIIIDNHEIRLIDIDAPEYSQKCIDAQKQYYDCGKSAKNYLTEITQNQKIICHISGKDYYSRYLATCYNSIYNINAMLVKNGWAISYSKNNKYYNDEQLAQKNKLGLWQGDFITPKQYRKLNPRP